MSHRKRDLSNYKSEEEGNKAVQPHHIVKIILNTRGYQNIILSGYQDQPMGVTIYIGAW